MLKKYTRKRGKVSKKNTKKYKKKQTGGSLSFNGKEIKVVIITLNEREKAFNLIKHSLKKLNIKFNKFNAIDTRGLDTRILNLLPNIDQFISNNDNKQFGNDYYTKYKDELLARNKLGSLGCSLSHMYIYKEIMEKNIPYTIILEEDAVIQDNFIKELNKSLKFLPKDWDILFLGFSCEYKHDERCHKNDNHNKYNGNIYNISYVYGTYGYLINKNGVEKIYKNIFPLWWHLDTMLSYLIQLGKLKAYALVPNIIFHPGKFGVDSMNYKVDTPYIEYVSTLDSKQQDFQNVIF
jgi:glycosyl transferase, family 25